MPPLTFLHAPALLRWPQVLDTFIFGDRALLAAHPQLMHSQVHCHFHSDVPALQRSEVWGTLGERTSWQAMPTELPERLKLLLFGFPTALSPADAARSFAAAAAASSSAAPQAQPPSGAANSIVGAPQPPPTVAPPRQQQQQEQEQQAVYAGASASLAAADTPLPARERLAAAVAPVAGGGGSGSSNGAAPASQLYVGRYVLPRSAMRVMDESAPGGSPPAAAASPSGACGGEALSGLPQLVPVAVVAQRQPSLSAAARTETN